MLRVRRRLPVGLSRPGTWRRSKNDDPGFTDAEVLTVALMPRLLPDRHVETDLPACLAKRAGGVFQATRLQAVDPSVE